MKDFLIRAAEYFEIIAWTSSQKDYSDLVTKEVERKLHPFKFSHTLCIQEQAPSVDKDIFVKSLEILQGNRRQSDIIIMDSHMSNFTNSLTNGIFVPSF